jgi:NADH-quinone oxidoreductase subunit D
MVARSGEILARSVPGIEVKEVSYDERGYNFAATASAGNIERAVIALDGEGYYIQDMTCIDFGEYLEVVYFFNHHKSLCRTKLTVAVPPDNAHVPTISRIYGAAFYYEREIHEFFGVLFDGHPYMSYLFLHDGIDIYPLRKGNVPVPAADKKLLNRTKIFDDEESFFLNMGPQHPSTHGVLRVILRMNGEYIETAEPVLGYLHRMHEKMAENRSYQQFLPNTGRMDYMGAMIFNLGYVETVEKLCGIPVPPRSLYVRVIASELARISSHLLWLGAYLADLGALTPFLYVFDDRENILDLLESITGSRLTYCYFRFGGLYNDVDDAFIAGTKRFLDRMRSRFKLYDDLVTGNVIFVNRTKDIGVIDSELARHFGVSGPVARSTNLAYDMRKVEPYAAYGEIDFEAVKRESGDALDRYMIRIKEMETSVNIIDKALQALPDGPYMAEKVPKKLKPPKGDIYHAVESPRGELGIYIVSDESDTPYRMKWRPPSYSNLIVFPTLAQGVMMADAVSILGSLDLVIPEIDR